MTAQTQAQLLLGELDRLAVRSEAPCRVDLAGGTLDLYPLCAFEAPTLTVNVAVDVLCRADLRVRTDGQIVIRSEDRGLEVRYDNLAELIESSAETPLGLLVEAVRFWQPPLGLELVTSSEAPPGSGLGGSSALLVAALGALQTMFGGRFGQQEPPDNLRLVQRAAAIEAKHLKVPTGSQDHIAALLGGVLGIRYDADGPYVEKLALSSAMHAFLKEHLVVIYTGEHASASPNWAIFKAYVEGDDATRRRVEELKKVAVQMAEALVRGDQDKVIELIDKDWSVRRELAEGVTTPELDAVLAAVREAGARAVRPVGAAAGGSILALAHPSKHAAIVEAAEALGGRRLDARPTAQGIRLARLSVEMLWPKLTVVEGGEDEGDEPEAPDAAATAGGEVGETGGAGGAGGDAAASGAAGEAPSPAAAGEAAPAAEPAASPEGAADAAASAAEGAARASGQAPAASADEGGKAYSDGDPTETLPAVGA